MLGEMENSSSKLFGSYRRCWQSLQLTLKPPRRYLFIAVARSGN
jgi:hypothetical protein